MKKILFLAAISLAVTSCMTVAVPGPARGGGGGASGRVLLGERTVNFKADHDVIGVGAYNGTFRALYFEVEKNDVELFNIVVVYGNGDREKFDTRLIFREGTRSRMLDLRGGKRIIKSIQFTYRTVGTWAEGKARVVVYGVK
jgi:hypothetical protein